VFLKEIGKLNDNDNNYINYYLLSYYHHEKVNLTPEWYNCFLLIYFSLFFLLLYEDYLEKILRENSSVKPNPIIIYDPILLKNQDSDINKPPLLNIKVNKHRIKNKNNTK
jgi:hypothetical protein